MFLRAFRDNFREDFREHFREDSKVYLIEPNTFWLSCCDLSFGEQRGKSAALLTSNEHACFPSFAAYPRENGIQVHPIRFEREMLLWSPPSLPLSPWVGQPRQCGFTV